MNHPALRILFLLFAASAAWSQPSWVGGANGLIEYTGGPVGIGIAADYPPYSPTYYPLYLGTWVYGGPSTTYHQAGTMFGIDVPHNVELAFGWNGVGPNYSYWIQPRTASNTASTLSLNPVGGQVTIGTLVPNATATLSVDGTIAAKDIYVTNANWSDYVFAAGYRLAPLSEVKEYIQANHHLPDMPSEAEVKEQGVDVSDMQAKLLAKVEELTLHMIAADKRSDQLAQTNEELAERNLELQGQMAELRAQVNAVAGPAKGK